MFSNEYRVLTLFREYKGRGISGYQNKKWRHIAIIRAKRKHNKYRCFTITFQNCQGKIYYYIVKTSANKVFSVCFYEKNL